MTRTFRFAAIAALSLAAASARAGVADFDPKAAPAEGAALEKIRSEVEFALAGLRASRDLIRRGRFELKERRVEEMVGTGTLASVEIASKTAFDDDAHLLRVEHEQTKPFPTPNRFIYVETPEHAFFYNQQGSFSVVRPGYLQNENANPPVDIRAIGAGLYYDFVSRGGARAGDGIDALTKAILENARFVGVRRVGNQFEIEYFPDAFKVSRFKLVLDESRGFVPVRMEVIVLDGETKRWRDDQLTETTWTKVGDSWLPATLRSTLAVPKRELDLTFRWLSVNEPLDPSLFKRESITVPDGTYISDLTIKPGRATLVEVAGAPKGYELLRTRGNRRVAPLTFINVVALIVVCAAVAYHWSRRSRRRG